VWTFLLPILALFGYSLSLIMMAFFVLYGFYMLVDLAWICVAWLGVGETARRRLLNFLWILPAMPLYRMVIFWFRIAGFLHAIAEPGAWRVQDPVVQAQRGFADLRLSTARILGNLLLNNSEFREKFGSGKSGDPSQQ
jgi:hypothetical protein